MDLQIGRAALTRRANRHLRCRSTQHVVVGATMNELSPQGRRGQSDCVLGSPGAFIAATTFGRSCGRPPGFLTSAIRTPWRDW